MRISSSLIKWCSIVMLMLLSSSGWAANQLKAVRIWPAPENLRLVFDLNNKPQYSYFSLQSPNRLVLDFKQTNNGVDFSRVVTKSKLVKKVRLSKAPKKSSLRVVLELTRAVKPSVFTLPPTSPYGDRLVIDLPLLATAPQVIAKQAPKGARDIVVAVDAGHGGEDPGSIGASGKYEKRVTLQIAKRLATLINKQPGMRAVLTRRGDYYVGLDRRSEVARKAGADLLVSIHADAFTSPQPHGASVLVLSNRRANSEIGRLLEQAEKHSELLGGVGEIIQSSENEKYLARTLIDMSMDNSMAESYEIGRYILKDMGKITRLHKKKPVLASLAVLKSPDFPSILVETGFVSNPAEERKLHTASHRNKLAQAIFASINKYFRSNPPDGTRFARQLADAPRRLSEHVVQRGESLSLLANRYNVTVARLKQTNRLKSNMVRIGQVLTIPQS